MGAYYKAVNIDDNNSMEPWDFECGTKLAEHSYVGNKYINAVLHQIEFGSWKNKPLVWACDYDNNSAFGKAYDSSSTIKIHKDDHDKIWEHYDSIIINNSKKEYIDLAEYQMHYIDRSSAIVHPFPILTSSTNKHMGGGDFDFEGDKYGDWRSRWAGDKFVVTRITTKIPSNYTNISHIWFENRYQDGECIEVFRNDKMWMKSIQTNLDPDLDTSDKMLGNFSLTSDDDKSEVINLLRNNEKIKLTFKKVDGTVCTKMATLSEQNKENSTEDSLDPYLWFFDLDDNKIKRMVFNNFISAEEVAA